MDTKASRNFSRNVALHIYDTPWLLFSKNNLHKLIFLLIIMSGLHTMRP